MRNRAMRKFLAVLLALFVLPAFSFSPVQAAPAAASQWVNPLELDFGPVGLGSSVQRVVTITNSGTVPLTGWAGGAVSSPFSASQDCNISGGVLPGHSCHYYFTFSPTTAGAFSATSTSSTVAGTISVIVHGSGVGAQATYDSHGLDFGNIYASPKITGTAPQQVVTIRNTGLAPLTGWAGGAVSAPFSASQDCNITGGVLPGHSCHYYFDFSTNSDSTFSATSTSSTNGGSIVVDLTGASHPLLITNAGQQVTPFSIDFGPVGVGQNAPTLSVAITNHNTTNITGWADGALPAPFSASQDCNIAGGLPPGATCHYYFTFHPTSAGGFTATSASTDSAGPFSIEVRGTGVAPAMTVDSQWIDFGPSVSFGTHMQTITITNTGLSPITGWAGGAVPAPFNGSQDCVIPGGLQPGASCHFYYTFQPTGPGSYAATSTFSTNAGTFHVKMQGTYRAAIDTFIPLVVH